MTIDFDIWWKIILFVVVFLPSIITALTKVPGSESAVKWLRVLLDGLSILTHSDAQGMMKMPLTRSVKAEEEKTE